MSIRTHLLFYSPKNKEVFSPFEVEDNIADGKFNAGSIWNLDSSLDISRGDVVYMAVNDNFLHRGSKAMIYARGFALSAPIPVKDFFELDIQIDYIADPESVQLPTVSEIETLCGHTFDRKASGITLEDEEAEALKKLFIGWKDSNTDLFNLRRNRYKAWTLYDETAARSFQITARVIPLGGQDILLDHSIVSIIDNEIRITVIRFRGDPVSVFSDSLEDESESTYVCLLDATDFMENYGLDTMEDLVSFLFNEFGDLSPDELIRKLDEEGYDYDDSIGDDDWDEDYPDDRDEGSGHMGFPPFSPNGKRPQN